MPYPVLAHDFSKDPYLNYANRQALSLWGISWEQMIKMPSKLTAPQEERSKREAILNYADKKHAIKGYTGIRISSKGQKFIIKDARIWTIWNDEERPCGQAATFNRWEKISM